MKSLYIFWNFFCMNTSSFETQVFCLVKQVNILKLWVVIELPSQHFFSGEMSWVHLMEKCFVFLAQVSGCLFSKYSACASCSFPCQTCKTWRGLISYLNCDFCDCHLFIKNKTQSWDHKLPTIIIPFLLWWKINTVKEGPSEI